MRTIIIPRAEGSIYYEQKEIIKKTITRIYHKNHGILGYRQMEIFLEREGICISCTACHRYMNTELKLYSICRRKRNSHVSDDKLSEAVSDFAYI